MAAQPAAQPAAPADAQPEGLLLLDKPAGWTSHDVVARVRRLAGTRRVGHAGTLDPMATGVLVLGLGRATKLLTFLVGCDKSYAATIRLGATTVTDDAEGAITATTAVDLAPGALEAAVTGLTGAIAQVPSAVSAIKVDGKRAYARVRGGEDVALPARRVTVSRFAIGERRAVEVDGIRLLDVDVEVDVSSGTYVRALARDLGAALGVGGHLTALRRTRVGRFTLAECTTLEALAAARDAGAPLPMATLDQAATGFPTRGLTADEARHLSFGRRIPAAQPGRTEAVAALDPDGRLVAMLDESRSTARAHVVFAPASS
ncbi:MAG: tRNA pseudouridine(55) synthase TruB [Dermatophilaceae bacterium]